MTLCVNLLSITVLMPCLLGWASAKVKLGLDGGYEGVTVAINPDIKENHNMMWRLEVRLLC